MPEQQIRDSGFKLAFSRLSAAARPIKRRLALSVTVSVGREGLTAHNESRGRKITSEEMFGEKD